MVSRSWGSFVLAALLVANPSCQQPPPGGCARDADCATGQFCNSGRCADRPFTAKLGPNTVVVGEEEVNGLVVREAEIEIPAGHTLAKRVRAGSILIGGSELVPLLRRVLSVDSVSSSWKVKTGPAMLTDAFEECDIWISTAARQIATALPSLKFKLEFPESWQFLSFSASTDLTAGMEPRFSFAPSLESFKLKIKGSQLEEFELILAGKADAQVYLDIVASLKKKYSLFKVDLTKSPLDSKGVFLGYLFFALPTVPPVPIWIDFYLKAEASLDLTVADTGQVKLGGMASGDYRVGLRFAAGSLKGISEPTWSFSPMFVPKGKVGLTMKGTLKPSLDMYFYDLAGPSIGLAEYVKGDLAVNPLAPNQLERKAAYGLELSVALKANLWGALKGELSYTLPPVEKVLLDDKICLWSCGDAGPDAGPEPDGPKPDASPCVHPPVVANCSSGWCSIPAGCFTMGSAASEPCRQSNEDTHQVTLTRGFEIASTEVTRSAFKSLLGYDPSFGGGTTDLTRPVEMVSWHEAAAYCNALSSSKSLAQCFTCTGSGANVTCDAKSAYAGTAYYTCPGYRLPTEGEWEYAYRAGSKTGYYDGTECGTSGAPDPIAWYQGNSGNVTHPVGGKLPNKWGLHDMAGNVWEWCYDWYTDHLGTLPVGDPAGPSTGVMRVNRGGCYAWSGSWTRAAYRNSYSPATKDPILGLRCVRTIP